MNVFEAEREAIAGKLTAGGVDYVTLDPRGEPPCVLVGLPRIVAGQGRGGWTVEYAVSIIVPPPGDLDAVGWMLDQLEPLMLALPDATGEAVTVTRNDAELPAYIVYVSRSVPNPTC